ncbi:hypothetical protein HN51_042558 [Arachis hypogaea]|uniref:FCS-Like Zinc finger 10 n=2 Tax=Arachis TaxID=3817 RepID=A0A6P4B807_ARADU|nr:FCS-Like Zinc finger 10 [Arachis duranensis]XP_015933625.1 FCS-Like Zinc finger 10 [Arachis duranensis]XP_015933627.1 FCS-Like Zinc finger 10 [Arachis duranensis]XP_025611043.1 FCS-Like Zinc finger 10 [Arachis hypogaea]XP_025611044.1 FCS-Like Zinc finger 10 [Arachis hypogaea]XP_025611045.1 FCS-Like Zinc finger 10 [Arachis hypogaea]XP_025611046.1 FCS-Like Zinc finger 10 [Arachis hypogaea]XP_025611047.1 FCS-Like Zinc finger 10 [Arachis hypogaea]XP_025671179.1 FCS-Like Zinc finger 10 [Arach
MADSSSGSSLPSENTSSLRQISYSLFHNSGCRVGPAAKGIPDSESAWSPTSPLDCKLFSNFSNPFGVKSSKASFGSGHKKQLNCGKVGLSIISSLVNEANLKDDEILGNCQLKNVLFRPLMNSGILKVSKKSQEYLSPHRKSNSLPKNYVISLPSETKISKFEVESFDDVSSKEELGHEGKPFKSNMTSLPDSLRPSSSLIYSNHKSNLGVIDLCVENASSALNLAPVAGRSLEVDNSLKIQSSSLPVSIDFSKGYIGSLSARDIELSEDYTCIISHGPNPKRTHIFGDCILECHKDDFTELGKKEEPAFGSSQVSTFSEGLPPYHSDNASSFCYSCHKKLEEGKDFNIFRGDKTFCSFNCGSEEEVEKTCSNSTDSSPGSSYHDLFFKGLLLSK